MKVFVYRNLHQQCLSVKALEGPNRGKVIAHVYSCLIEDGVFKVSQAGRARVLKEQQKNVHAGVQGQLIAVETKTQRYGQDLDNGIDLTEHPELKAAYTEGRIMYNPYKANHFFDESFQPVYNVRQCLITPFGIYRKGP